MPCNIHKCIKTCIECSGNHVCIQKCGKFKKLCGHVCSELCHTGDCDEFPCDHLLNSNCYHFENSSENHCGSYKFCPLMCEK